MRLNKLTLRDFRNYENQTADLSPGVNVLLGRNAQGKTNFLEAVSCLSDGKSFRTRHDRELIRIGRETAYLEGQSVARGREHVLSLTLRLGRKKEMTQNGSKVKSLSPYLATVVFRPEDLELIGDGAAVRRKFLDRAIGQLRPKYAEAVDEYARVYEHKTRILRDGAEKPSLYEALPDFNRRLCQLGTVIIRYRAFYVEKLAEKAARAHSELSGGRERLEIRYETVTGVTGLSTREEVYGALSSRLSELADSELASRSCLTGPHKDELAVSIDSLNARVFASQGQRRTAALSLKLAEREILAEALGETPVLLLDDVLSELDADRQDYVLRGLGESQILITCAGEPPKGLRGLYTLYVEGGQIRA
ncbi:MAG: DNA replication/repair protein RecF [Oscillospiraceae bacterium]|jgi:DNA replication and repair protein RecF